MSETTLEALLKQKYDIEQKIKELKAEYFVKSTRAKMETKQDQFGKKVWQVSIFMKYISYAWDKNRCRYVENSQKEKDRWNPIVRAYTKGEAIKRLDTVISDLKKLKKAISEKAEDEPEEVPFVDDSLEDLEEFDVADLADLDMDEEV